MLLNLRMNYFFRAFWSLDRTRLLTDIDLKYYDFPGISINRLNAWYNANKLKASKGSHVTDIEKVLYLGSRCKHIYIDVSYWDTYRLDDSDNYFYIDILFEVFYEYLDIRIMSLRGIKNIREVFPISEQTRSVSY